MLDCTEGYGNEGARLRSNQTAHAHEASEVGDSLHSLRSDGMGQDEMTADASGKRGHWVTTNARMRPSSSGVDSGDTSPPDRE